MTKRKTSTKPTRIWKFSARLETPEVAREILWRKGRYYNTLVEIERARHDRYGAIRAHYAPDLAALEKQWEELDDQIFELYREAKRDRQSHWRDSGGEKARLLPPEYGARKLALDQTKRAIADQSKPLRAGFAALIEPARSEYKRRTKELAGEAGPRTRSLVNARVLSEMLEEEWWHPAWKDIARSDAQAHERLLAARAHCRLYAGTYLDVESAFARAKEDSAPRAPRFKRALFEGKIQVQLKQGATWSSIGASDRLKIAIIASRPGVSKRCNMRRVTLDQSVGDDRLVVSATCRLHRLPPGDAEVKWLSLMIRPRRGSELQVTLEHESFAEPKRPAGVESPVHVCLGWGRSGLDLRVARLVRGAEVIDEVHCPERIASQKRYGESVEAFGDKLRGRALRTLRRVLHLTGNRVTHWRALETDRHRAWLRRQCEGYAQHVLGDEAVRVRWREWQRDRRARGVDLYASIRELRATMPGPEVFAWWCWIWARKDHHLEQLASDSRRRFQNRRDAHYRAEAIRISTRFERVSVDNYSIAKLKELEPLTMPGTGVRELGQSQLHAAAPGRFREILLEVMGPRGSSCERPSDAKNPLGARAKKAKQKRASGHQAAVE